MNEKTIKILLIISGSIAAYKSFDLIRKLKEGGLSISCVLTKAACNFVTPMSIASISESQVYSDLFSLKDESEMGHIRLSRENDLILVAPASADLIAKMANGLADDLASSILLASDKPVFMVPAMNVKMWENKAVQRNIKQLIQDGVQFIGPVTGKLACGEEGEGRMSAIEEIIRTIKDYLKKE